VKDGRDLGVQFVNNLKPSIVPTSIFQSQ